MRKQHLKSFTAILGLLIAITGIYYVQDSLFGNSLSEGDGLSKATTSYSPPEPLLSEKRKVKGRDGLKEDSDQETLDGIVLSSEVIAGENLRMVIYENNSRVAGETVYVNGKRVGETSSTGATTFQIPNAQTITIKTNEGHSITKEAKGHTVENNPVKFDITSPPNETRLNGYEPVFQFDIDSETDYTLQLVADGQTVRSVNLSAGESLSAFSHVFKEKGLHNWSLRAEIKENGEVFESETRYIETMQEPSLAEINLHSPSSVNATDPHTTDRHMNIDYSIRNFEDIITRVYLKKDDGAPKLQNTTELNAERNHGITLTPRTFEAGSYEWWVEAESKSTGQKMNSETLTFEVVSN